MKAGIANGRWPRSARSWDFPAWIEWHWPVLPRWEVVRIDETAYFNLEDEEVRAQIEQAGGVYGVYFYDTRESFVYASASPSMYNLEFLYYTSRDAPEDDREADALNEWLLEMGEGEHGENRPFDTKSIDALPAQDRHLLAPVLEFPDDDEERSRETMEDDVREYLHGNPVF